MIEEKAAVIVLCKCGKHHKTYGIRAEKISPDNWSFTWAFPIKEDSAKREGYDKSSIKGNISFSEDFPGCPYCGTRNWTVCSCGHLSCSLIQNGLFTCEWCGTKSTVGLYTGQSIAAGMDL